MKNGAMQKLIVSNVEEHTVANELKRIDNLILHFRGLIREGEEITQHQLENFAINN
jgi:hypothetical protein